VNKNKRLLKSGSRLSQLATMVEPSYAVIWDCCCDHGLLGKSLLRDQCAGEVIFVDVLENHMANLATTLAHNFPQDQYSWQVRCEDLKKIVVPAIESQLFIIAGVGPHQTIEFINSLCASAPDTEFDLLICSVHGSYSVREALIKQGYGLKSERIIFENNRFYEAIYVSKSVNKAIVDTGSQMWDWSDAVHQDYWHRIVGHYRQKSKADPQHFQPIIERYEALQNALKSTQN
jgi:tRNA (adenine22-N1)-methyltransferase